MFKRASKVTALALAAAAVVSLVPATGANAAAKRLGNKEGTVKEGIAFDGGKYSYYGFRSDEDLTGIYYNNGGEAKDTTSSDLDDYRYNTLSKYGTKYAYAHENSNKDEYLIDLSTGKIVDDETKEEKRDKAKTDLISKVKKAERYNGTDDKSQWVLPGFEQILQGQFGEVWFKYAAWGHETIGHTPVVSSTKTLVGYELPSKANVATTIYNYEFAKINGNTTDLPTYTYGANTYRYDNGAAAGVRTFHTYEDLVYLVKQDVINTIVPTISGILYDETTTTQVTTGGGTTTNTVVSGTHPLFTAANVVQSGNYVGVEAAVSGRLEDIAGVNNVEIGTIQDQADIAKAQVVYGAAETGNEAIDAQYFGFSDESGKYIDASYTANMKVYSSTKGRAVMINKYDEEDKDAKLTLHLESIDAITQDKDNIYAIATVNVTGDGATKATQYFLQKISKAQGDKENGAYTPKSVTSYLLDTGVYKEGDLQKAYDVLTATGTHQEGADEHPYLLGTTVKGSDLYVTRASKDNVKVYKFNLKSSFKSDVALVGNGDLKTDVDTPAVKWDDAKDTDVNDNFSVVDDAEDKGLIGITPVKPNDDEAQIQLYNQPLYRHPSVSIDVNGNTWALKKNTITKFDGLDKKEDIYSVDGAMDAFDVYDDNSLVAWDTDGDRYTNIKEGTAVTEGDGINVNADINKDKFKTGYDATEKKFYKDGKVVTNSWQSEAGKWYFVDEAGVAKTGWYQNAAGTWYLLGTDGAMLTGWQQDGGSWYYLNPVNTSGAMVTGWFQDTTGTWYYTTGSGKMLSNTVVDSYTLSASGAWVK